MIKRQAVESIEAQKHQMIAALYANSSFSKYKEGASDRAEQIKELEKHFAKAVELVYDPHSHDGKKIDWDNPFWSAHKRSIERTLDRLRGEGHTVAEILGTEEVEQQMNNRQRALSELDQHHG